MTTTTTPGVTAGNTKFYKLFGVLAVLMLWGYAALGQAAALNLTKSYPDIFIGTPLVTYNATTDLFSATGTSGDYQATSGSSAPFASASYSISAIIDASGVLSSGTVSLTTTGVIGGQTGTIFSGNIIRFGSSSGSNLYEFVVGVSSGSAALGFTAGSRLGVKLLAAAAGNGNGGLGSFNINFTNTGAPRAGATADNFAVPEPSSLALLGIGVLAARRASRRALVNKG